MNVYRVTYYTAGDSVACVNIEAATEADAVEYARQQDDVFAQIKSVMKIGDKNDMKTPQIPPLTGSTPLGMSPKPAPAQAAAATPAEQFRAEITKILVEQNKVILSLREEMTATRADVEAINAAMQTLIAGISHAATATPPAQSATVEMDISEIIMTTDESGKPVYKAKGSPYHKFGVRVWDEVLPLLGIDVAALRPGCNQPPQVIRARVLLATDPESGKTNPRKVIGKA